MNNFHYAQYLANELYGVEMPDDKFEEIVDFSELRDFLDVRRRD